jgi:hypothetical protein
LIWGSKTATELPLTAATTSHAHGPEEHNNFQSLPPAGWHLKLALSEILPSLFLLDCKIFKFVSKVKVV